MIARLGSDGQFGLRIAKRTDFAALFALRRDFWREADTATAANQEGALATLLGSPEYGRVYLVEGGLTSAAPRPVGFAILCWGYSVEFGGRDVFLDEFYISPDERGAGLGGMVLDKIAELLAADDIKAIHLDVLEADIRAARLYSRTGYAKRGMMMSRTL